MKYWPRGLGETTGDALVTMAPAYLSGDVWFVNSVIGLDDVSPAGKDRNAPLATLRQAITNAADNDIIVLMAGHTETPTSTITISKRLVIAAGGFSGGLPTVSITPAHSSIVLDVTVDAVEIRNVNFAKNASGFNNTRIRAGFTGTGANLRVIGCYFPLNFAPAIVFLSAAGVHGRIENCTFLSTGTSVASRASSAISASTVSLPDLTLENCTFDDGTYGFSSFAFTAFNAPRLRARNVSLLHGADMNLPSGSTGYIAGVTETGGGKVDWAA